VDAPDALRGWLPLRYVALPEPSLEWCWLGDCDPVDPFFCDTVERSFRRRPYSLLARRVTTFRELREMGSAERLRPAGFIFHVSRCGSTLISRTLATLPELRVLSEPPALDGVLRSGCGDGDVVLAVEAFLRRWESRPGQQAAVFKLDCWNVNQATRLRKLFPQTPQLFVYRNPLEVVVSQMTQPGAWTVRGALPAELLGMRDGEVDGMLREEYCARAVGHFLQYGAELAGESLLTPVEYSTLPDSLFTVVLRLFDVLPGVTDREKLRAAVKSSAKQPELAFEADTRRKVSLATPLIRECCDAFATPAWERLRNLWYL